MSSATDTLLDEIEELKDQLHNMHVDLKRSNETILYQKEQLEIAKERISDLQDELVDIGHEVTDRETTIEEMEQGDELHKEKIRKLEDEIKSLKFSLHANDEKYLKVLAMWETVRQGNMRYFNTVDGAKFLEWSDREFKHLSRRGL